MPCILFATDVTRILRSLYANPFENFNDGDTNIMISYLLRNFWFETLPTDVLKHDPKLLTQKVVAVDIVDNS